MKIVIYAIIFLMFTMLNFSCTPSAVAVVESVEVSRPPSGDGRIERFYEKYKHAVHRMGATGPDAFDCSGLTQTAFSELYNINLPRTSESQYMRGSRVTGINSLKYGDLVFFNIDGRGVSHVGIYLYDNKFLHASSSLGVTVSDITMDYWRRRYIEGRRIIK